LNRLKLEVIAVDLTLPEVKAAGLHVVRVLIPGMIPLTFGANYVCKGAARLANHDLNPIPHPFA
jgi:ribosomal protein S12 methylthiotransferase accessory factor